MKTIIVLLALPIVIKLFTRLGFWRLSLIPKTMISAEMVIEDINKRKIRSAKVEIAYCYTQKLFHDRLQNKELTRDRILAIRKYLNMTVHQYPHKEFKNDAHAIYVMLLSKDISVRNLDIVQQLISTIDRSVDSNWINISAIVNKWFKF